MAKISNINFSLSMDYIYWNWTHIIFILENRGMLGASHRVYLIDFRVWNILLDLDLL